jgi:peptidoglycan/xylan/chitin deacetylase (PgdA/CDA1 family)
VLGWLVAILAIAAIVVVGRRWIHHAQLELIPVIVPPNADVAAIAAPPPGAVVRRMLLDVQDVLSRPVRPRLAVLTFDDGPYPVESPALESELASLRVPAVFFLIGDDAMQQPAIARRMAAAGMEIGDHTLTHPELPSLSYAAQLAEIEGGKTAIASATGAQPHYFRPPHGNFTADTLKAASAGGETTALWDDDPGDWRTLSPQEIVRGVEAQAKAPAIILLHSGKDATIDALPEIVRAFRSAGFRFVTLSELERAMPDDAINDPIKVKL